MGTNDVNVKGHHNTVFNGMPYYKHPKTGRLRIIGGPTDKRESKIASGVRSRNGKTINELSQRILDLCNQNQDASASDILRMALASGIKATINNVYWVRHRWYRNGLPKSKKIISTTTVKTTEKEISVPMTGQQVSVTIGNITITIKVG